MENVVLLKKLLKAAYEEANISIRDLGLICDIDYTMISRYLNLERYPPRDALISLCAFCWHMDLDPTNEILIAADWTPIGRKARADTRLNEQPTKK